MTTQKLFIIAALCSTLFTACKKKDKEDETNPIVPENALSQIATQLNLLDQAAVKYNQYQDTLNNSLFSLYEMAQWLIQQPAVDKAYIIDEYIINVHFKSGLKSSISVIPVDANGQHLIRGGGSLIAGSDKNSKTIALKNFGSYNKINGGSETIGNNKVLIFIPYFNQLYNGNFTLIPKFSQGSTPLIPTLKTEKDADLVGVDFFSDYGFIIINTHGTINGFEILTKIDELDIPVPPGSAAYTEESLQQLFLQANNLPINKVMSGLLEIKMSILEKVNDTIALRAYAVKVTDNYIRSIQHLDKAVVLGNYCYSGFTKDGATTNNMAEAFKSIGAVAYYGYAYGDGTSTKTDNDFARQMEDSLITNLVINDDSTGIAHLSNDITEQEQPNSKKRTGGIQVQVKQDDPGVVMAATIEYTTEHPLVILPFYFKHYFDPRYGYGCGTFTDPRDNKVYELACIGNQTWFAENLNWAGAGVCYDNNSSNCDTYGRLYSLDEATGQNLSTDTSHVQGVCPPGWHIPSKAECEELINFSGGPAAAATKLRSTSGWPTPNSNTNDYGFNLLPAGYFAGSSTNSIFANTGTGAYFWTASKDSSQNLFYALKAYHPTLGIDYYSPPPSLTWKFSCRCIKD